MRNLISILVYCLCANVALSGVIVSVPDSGRYNQGGLEAGAFRWGATVEKVDFTHGDWPPRIGFRNMMNDGSQAWLLPGAPSERFPRHPPALSEGRPDTSPANGFLFNTAPDAEESVDSFDEIIAGYREAADLRYARISNSKGLLSDMDFLFEGTLHIDWTGTAPRQDESGIRATMNQIPEPASIVMVIMAGGLGLIIRRRFRS
jgi:hypothetical protein